MVTADYLRRAGEPGGWDSRPRLMLGAWAVRCWRTISSNVPEFYELDESAYGDAAADLLHHATASGYNTDLLCTLAGELHNTSDGKQHNAATVRPGEYVYVLAMLLADIYAAAEADGLTVEEVEFSARLHHDAEQAEGPHV